MPVLKLWEHVPGFCETEPLLTYYPAEPGQRKSDATVVIFPGGGYAGLAPHEGEGYARYLNSLGMDAFVCSYRVAPHRFPWPLLDARRAVRWVRAHAEEYHIRPDRIAVMGSSAGGHLAALVSTYTKPVEGEGVDALDAVSPRPDATILCYPVIHQPDETGVSHVGSYRNLLGADASHDADYAPDLLVSDATPPAFLWHTSEDGAVNVINSYLYATALRQHGILHEMHIFPHGAHGLGLAEQEPHTAQWSGLLKNWFVSMGWL